MNLQSKVRYSMQYDHPNFEYYTRYVRWTELRTKGKTDKRTKRQMDRWMDYPIIKYPRQTFQAGALKYKIIKQDQFQFEVCIDVLL